MTDKSKCFDIFQKTKVNNFQMYPQNNSLDFMSYNNEMKRKTKMLQRIQIVKGFASHAFTGYGNLTYIKITLKEIKISKELFVL